MIPERKKNTRIRKREKQGAQTSLSVRALGLAAALCILSLAIAPALSFAADYIPLAPIPGTQPATGGATNLPTYLSGLFKVGIAAAGVLAFLMLVIGGITYMSTDVWTNKEEGKEIMKNAIGGLLLALLSFAILYTINPALVEFNLNFGATNLREAAGPPLEDPGQAARDAISRLQNAGRTNEAELVRPTLAVINRERNQAIDLLVEAGHTAAGTFGFGETSGVKLIEEALRSPSFLSKLRSAELIRLKILADGVRDVAALKEKGADAAAEEARSYAQLSARFVDRAINCRKSNPFDDAKFSACISTNH